MRAKPKTRISNLVFPIFIGPILLALYVTITVLGCLVKAGIINEY